MLSFEISFDIQVEHEGSKKKKKKKKRLFNRTRGQSGPSVFF